MKYDRLFVLYTVATLCLAALGCDASSDTVVDQNTESQALQQQIGDQSVVDVCDSLKAGQPGSKTLQVALGTTVMRYDETGATPTNLSFSDAICTDTSNAKSDIAVGLWDCSERSTQCLGFCNSWCKENGGGSCKTAYCGAIWCTSICTY